MKSSSYYNVQPNTQQEVVQNQKYIFSMNKPESFLEKLSNEQQTSII